MYVPEHAAYIAKLRAVGMPARKVQGAVYETYSTTFQKDVGLYLTRFAAELRSFCYHVYAVGGCGGATATVAELLSDERWLPNGTLRLGRFIAMAEAKGVPFVVGESNSVSCGGGTGVSNTFASSLWVPHFLAELSKGGVGRVNIHGGPLEIYAPIRFKEGTLLVEPLYYGMLAFAELTANHSRWLATRSLQQHRSSWRMPLSTCTGTSRCFSLRRTSPMQGQTHERSRCVWMQPIPTGLAALPRSLR
jgi:hypothetical protein